MNRRKRHLIPNRLEDAKIQRLSWNMADDHMLNGFYRRDSSINHKYSDNINEDSSGSVNPTLLTLMERENDEIECELKLNNAEVVKSSVGLLGSFSGVIWPRECRQRTPGEASRSGLVFKLCKAKAADKEDGQSSIVNEVDYVEVNATIEQVNALSFLQTKSLVSVLTDIEGTRKPPQENSIELLVYLNEKAISKVTLSSEDPGSKKTDKMIKIVMEWFHGPCMPDSVYESPQGYDYDDNLESLFDALKTKRKAFRSANGDMSDDCVDETMSTCEPFTTEDKDLEKLQHPSLVPSLRRYQKKSIRWMIERETLNATLTTKENFTPHPLWKAIALADDLLVHYNPLSGRISRDQFYHNGYPSGGILADEMGLGKTVEVLACILNHPMDDKEESHNQLNEHIEETMDEKIFSNECPFQPDSISVELQQDVKMSSECYNSFKDCSPKNMASDCHVPLLENMCNILPAPNMSNANEKDVVTGAPNGHDTALETLNHFKEEKIESDHTQVEKPCLKPEVVEEKIPIRCVCGENTTTQRDGVLTCSSCGFSQHSKCIGRKKTSEEKYVCPDCVVKMPIIDSKATLIISPVTIAHQWLDEVHRHILPGSLDILVYEGVAKQGFIYPSVLADNDIIFTTYDVLKKDFDYLASRKDNKSFRHRKRYATWSCPLPCIKFWRICLDEAQMVENTTAKATETALNLSAVHRWCVTGTPIQRGLEDLYGLLLFLGVEPYYRKTWWKKLLYEPFLKGNSEPLLDVLYHIMWRTAKKDVINEINLPEQQESVKYFNFSPVENHFYRRQHEECSSFALKELNKFQESMTKLNSLDKYSIQRVMGPLLSLRQACCHPQTVRGGFLSFQKSTITMEQLLEALIAKAKKESEEAHRLLLCAMNGLAGTFILQENWQQAVDIYREAMGSWREHEELLKTDSLQKLHTLHNLHEVLNQGFSNCSRTLRDDLLKEEASELSEKYLEKWKDQVKLAESEVDSARKKHDELRQKVDFECPWWVTFLEDILHVEETYSAERKLPEKLVEKVKDDLVARNNARELGSLSMADSFTDLRGLQFLLITKFDAIEKSQENLCLELKTLLLEPTKEIIITAAECCLRPMINSRAQRCCFCKVDDIFSVYESLLFGHQGVNNVDQESQQLAGGLRGETEAERSLKSIYNFLKTLRKHDKTYLELQRQAQCHFDYLDLMKKNFKAYRQLWFALRQRVSALDELEMCAMRLRLRFPGEIIEENQFHIIHPIEIEAVQMKFRSDRVIANSDLRKSLGQLLYLKNLAKTQSNDNGENFELCPVCTKSLGFQWSVFSCGHCLCCDCMWVLRKQPGLPGRVAAYVKCPMCRAHTMIQDISYVSTTKQMTEDEKDLVVKGSHSTKIGAIVRTLLRIQRTDPIAKTLVFSTWQNVLQHISYALTENDINHRSIKGRKDFQEGLEEFKSAADIPVLLIPLESGSNGLNIIEATHVILVEPSLNPSLERQAVGRVHRIGQTKPTFIHRLLIANTVEEKIMTFLQNKTVSGIRCGTRRADKDNIPLTLGELASFFEPTEI